MLTTGLGWFHTGALVALVGAAITVAGCASQRPVPPAGLDQKIEHAISRADHEGLASQYEQQAAVASAAATRHKGYAAIYRKNTSPRSGPEAHVTLAKHCESLAQAYEQAASENLAMARLHRDLAAEAK